MKEHIQISQPKKKQTQEQDWDGTIAIKLNTTST